METKKRMARTGTVDVDEVENTAEAEMEERVVAMERRVDRLEGVLEQAVVSLTAVAGALMPLRQTMFGGDPE